MSAETDLDTALLTHDRQVVAPAVNEEIHGTALDVTLTNARNILTDALPTTANGTVSAAPRKIIDRSQTPFGKYYTPCGPEQLGRLQAWASRQGIEKTAQMDITGEVIRRYMPNVTRYAVEKTNPLADLRYLKDIGYQVLKRAAWTFDPESPDEDFGLIAVPEIEEAIRAASEAGRPAITTHTDGEGTRRANVVEWAKDREVPGDNYQQIVVSLERGEEQWLTEKAAELCDEPAARTFIRQVGQDAMHRLLTFFNPRKGAFSFENFVRRFTEREMRDAAKTLGVKKTNDDALPKAAKGPAVDQLQQTAVMNWAKEFGVPGENFNAVVDAVIAGEEGWLKQTAADLSGNALVQEQLIATGAAAFRRLMLKFNPNAGSFQTQVRFYAERDMKEDVARFQKTPLPAAAPHTEPPPVPAVANATVERLTAVVQAMPAPTAKVAVNIPDAAPVLSREETVIRWAKMRFMRAPNYQHVVDAIVTELIPWLRQTANDLSSDLSIRDELFALGTKMIPVHMNTFHPTTMSFEQTVKQATKEDMQQSLGSDTKMKKTPAGQAPKSTMPEPDLGALGLGKKYRGQDRGIAAQEAVDTDKQRRVRTYMLAVIPTASRMPFSKLLEEMETQFEQAALKAANEEQVPLDIRDRIQKKNLHSWAKSALKKAVVDYDPQNNGRFVEHVHDYVIQRFKDEYLRIRHQLGLVRT